MFAAIDDAAIEPGFRYLVCLFRGDLAERRGDDAVAEQSYRAAAGTLPLAQSAQLALAHRLHAGGQRADAGALVRDVATLRDASGSADPWLWYLRGMSWRVPACLAELRQMIHPEPDR